MDGAHLANAVRYVSLNPVRAQLVGQAAEWRWSSVCAHLAGEDDGLVKVAPVLARYGDFAAFLAAPVDGDAQAWRALRQSETSGRPIGAAAWSALRHGLRCWKRAADARSPRKKRGPKPRLGHAGNALHQ
jgi:putative transposase